MQYFFYLLAIVFIYINYKIIKSDIKYKKIPNKLLLYLILIIPFFYLFLYITNIEINILTFIIQIFLSILISFVLYYFWIWSAWDAKYLLVLSIFIPQNWIVSFTWNIAIITIIYLLIYFIYFYFWRCLFNWNYAKSLYKNIFIDLSNKFKTYIKHHDWNFYINTITYKILKFLSIFLIIFVSIRLARIYLIKNYLLNNSENNWWIIKFIINLMIENNSYFIFLILIIFFASIYLVIKLLNKLKFYISEKFKQNKKIKINPIIIEICFIFFLFSILIWYVISEYIKNPYEISNNLYKIFTIYLIIYLIFIILKYSYKVTFQLWEQDFIDIWKLRPWDIVDKEYLIHLFGTQAVLWAAWDKQNISWLFYPDPKNYILEIENPINAETRKKIINAYKDVNKYHLKEKTLNFSEIKSIKILKTFSFWIYIFTWFIITYFYWNFIFKFIIDSLISYLKIRN